ncbi:MAG TPA: 2-oxoglutarate dehydrogenase E1 component, partial [Alphaproteobacteria bacterium]|nr:2-oxoglutarate dehydrogenase E1 component [Alphaproteobacteria bacterium]
MTAPALNASNIAYVAGLYDRYKKDASSIDQSWTQYFRQLNENDTAMLAELTGASWTPKQAKLPDEIALPEKKSKGGDKPAAAPAASSADLQQAVLDAVRLHSLVRAYRTSGHFAANLDPLGIEKPKDLPELRPEYYGFTADDYDRPIYAQGLFGKETITLRALIAALRETYCGDIGVEFTHVTDKAQWDWLLNKIESNRNHIDFTKAEKTEILREVTASEGLEKFLSKKFVD